MVLVKDNGTTFNLYVSRVDIDTHITISILVLAMTTTHWLVVIYKPPRVGNVLFSH